MSRSKLRKLEDRVGWLGRLVVVAIVLVVGMLAAMLVHQADGWEVKVQPMIAMDFDSGAVVKPMPAVEPVADALVTASLKDYAGLEAERMAKMAAALMGMGGDYTAECRTVYNAATERVETWYVITWFKVAGIEVNSVIVLDEGEKPIEKSFAGAAWGECIQKMLAWKQGGE